MAQTISDALTNAQDWRSAANSLCDWYIEHNRCFSSGEIAREIRINRPDIAFSVRTLGEHMRDLFYSGGMKDYEDGYGDTQYPAQVPRTTQGIGRTPSGVEVFVYCPETAEGFAHGFEVDIPAPPARRQPQNAPQSAPAQASQPKQPRSGVSIKANANGSLSATVFNDRRLCISRGTFEVFVHKTGRPLRGGDPVHIQFDGSKVKITLDPDPNGLSMSYDLASSRGRVLFPSQGSPFSPGDSFTVTVDKDALTVDLSAPQ
ncbi:hypothetical protein N9917_01435 [Deltaproteobacteria bacterium]|nr:hypothetical protein [Deltaproteobacteria bacterium]